MDWLTHFKTFSTYNARLNQQVYEAASSLSEADLNKDRGSFFKSISGTLNHIMVGDLFWLNRFRKLHSPQGGTFHSLNKLRGFPKPTALNEILFEDFEQLKAARYELDEIIKCWSTEELTEEDFKLDLNYRDSKGESYTKNFGALLSHFFNHQTHHRGQVSTLLSQAGVDIGVTDLLIYIDEI